MGDSDCPEFSTLGDGYDITETYTSGPLVFAVGGGPDVFTSSSSSPSHRTSTEAVMAVSLPPLLKMFKFSPSNSLESRIKNLLLAVLNVFFL